MKKLLSGIMALSLLAGMSASLPYIPQDTSVYQLTADAADYGSLSNPNATAEMKSLYNFLCDTYGNYVISGQQESTWMGSEDYEFNIIKNASGKLPVIRGLDYMGDDFSGCNRRAKAWAAKGGIVTICWHCGSDFTGSHTESMNTDLDWSKALTPGTAEYNKLIAGMDKGAKALLELQEAGVPVIWRPFHETDGGWFWWSKGGADNFKKLWQIMYDRYTNHWGLNNLIWICGYSGEVKNGWYPGDEYVDIIGADTYVDHTDSLADMYKKTSKVSNKPVCLHENGPIPDPEKMKSDGAKWLWFMTWHTSFIDDGKSNPTDYIKRVYNSDYMLTLDEIPDVYHYGSSDVTFDTQSFTIGSVKKGEKITFHLEGTPNAYTNGCVAYPDGGEWTGDEWEGTFNSSGKLDITWTASKDISGAEFQIWWAGLWDDATQSNKNASSMLKSFDKGENSSTTSGFTANPIISRNKPAYSGNSKTASQGNDDAYWNTWDATAPDYLAYDLSSVPASQRKQVIAVWYNTSTYDDIGAYVNRAAEPIDYVIEINSAAGGTYPKDGWKTVKTVSENALSSRQCVVDMNGANWIRIRVTKAMDSKVNLNFDIHDASNGVSDSWIFFGDSITAGSMVNSYGMSFAARVNELDSRFFPVQENGGIGGTVSGQGKAAIDGWLSDSSAKYVSIAYGTNDCWGNPNGADNYYSNTKYMIDAVLKAGKIPVLPKIPYSTNSDVGNNVGKYNAKIDQLYSEYGDKLVHGPDFEAFFKQNTKLLGDDGVHPSFDGYEAMRKLWAETMYANVYSKATEIPSIVSVKGDVNGDGQFNVSDLVIMQKWLLAVPNVTLINWEAGDLCEDGIIDAFDLVMMRRELVNTTVSPEFSVVYEAEKATLGGKNSVVDDASASGKKAVGSFSDDADTVTFTVDIPTSGSYQLIFRSKGLGGEKENNVIIDGIQAGSFKSTTDYTDAALRRVMLTNGSHKITVSKSWGWIQLDCLTIKNDEAISNSVYNVSPKLIDSKADANTQKLFNFLSDSYGKYTIAGQVGDDGLNSPEFQSIYAETGKYPAICGLDFMDYTPSRTALGAKGNSVNTALAFHKAGGIVTYCWHWNAPTEYLKSGNDENGNPRWWGGFNTANTDFDIAAVMNGKDAQGKALLDRDIKEIASQIKILEDAGVPILWRPLHEASGGWFWWGAKGPDAYKKLWVYLYDQLTNVYGCHNLIWVWNGQAKEWYPGDEYVDIIGEDIYTDKHNYSAQNAKFSEALEYSDSNKIIALTENGVIPDIDNLIAANSKWAWFGTWCGGYVTENGKYSETFTDKAMLKKVYQSEYVITLDELPDLK